MARLWLHRGGSLRRGALFGALALALTTAGLVGGAAAAPSSASLGAPECVTSTARVKPGSHVDEPNQLSAAEAAVAERRSVTRMRAKGLSAARVATFPKVQVDVYVHVIRRSNKTGGVTTAQIDRQIEVLNRAFSARSARRSANTLFRFQLAGTTTTNNDDWYDWASPDVDPADENEAKEALHQGGKDDLNIYIAGLGDGLLGYAYYPDDEEIESYQDGVVLLNDSLPGGSAAPYNFGDTATHEVGHWLGLAHTFDNGCNSPGDYVADTPYQDDGENVFSCNELLNTCDQPGRDPVHNFMSYGDDACLNLFTAGQSQRMALQWYAYRSPTAP